MAPLHVGVAELRLHAFADNLRENVEERLADVAGEGEMGVEMILQPVEENSADAARDIAVGQPEIFLGPFREARIESRIVRGAGRAKAGVERLGVFLVGDRRVEIGAAAEPAPRGGQEAAVHVHRRDMRIGHVRDQADSGREEARVYLGAGD